MIYLMAPWELIQTTTMLPNPDLGDLRSKVLSVNIRNTINGTFYSYKKSNATYITNPNNTVSKYDRYRLIWEFKLRRGKADELKAFIETYSGYAWRVVDWKERVYRVHLINDPVDFTCITGDGLHVVRLELEGYRYVAEPDPNSDVNVQGGQE